MIDPKQLYPLHTFKLTPFKEMIFLKQFITHPHIHVGDYTYYHDQDHPEDFEKRNVIVLTNSKLIIGKFCQLAQGTTFIMSGANHPMEGFSTFPFFIFGGAWSQYVPHLKDKGDTTVGNDVWFGHQATILPGIKIGDGAIIGAFAVVTQDVPAYGIVAGNPAQLIRKRFSDAVIHQLQVIKWWDWDFEKITRNISSITHSDIEALQRAT